jgi:hypothetical protein
MYTRVREYQKSALDAASEPSQLGGTQAQRLIFALAPG